MKPKILNRKMKKILGKLEECHTHLQHRKFLHVTQLNPAQLVFVAFLNGPCTFWFISY